MKCPKCWNLETRVIDSRVIDDGKAIKRRRQCEYCDNRFSTFEKIWITELVVIKRDGVKELYERTKLKKAIMLAFAKRDFPIEKIEDIIFNLETKWSVNKEISSQQIGDDILIALKSSDPVAYVRFASVYKKFDSLKDFKQIIEW